MTNKQYKLSLNIIYLLKRNYTRIVKVNNPNDAYDIKAYKNAKCLLDFPDFGGELMGNAADKAGYSNSIINDIYNNGKHCRRLIETIEPFIMNQWDMFIKKGELPMYIDDVKNVDDLCEYIVDSNYREEDLGDYNILMRRVEEKIGELWSNEDNDESDDWMGFLGDERGMITLYRVLPTDWKGNLKESIEDGNIGMSWVSSIEDLDRVPWYEEETSTVVKVEVPVNDKTYIAFNNFLDRMVEVVLPNACKKYNVEYVTKGE